MGGASLSRSAKTYQSFSTSQQASKCWALIGFPPHIFLSLWRACCSVLVCRLDVCPGKGRMEAVLELQQQVLALCLVVLQRHGRNHGRAHGVTSLQVPHGGFDVYE